MKPNACLRGRAASDPAVIAEVTRRFFHTASGFEATNWLATRWLDRGEYALAIRAWKLLASDPYHRKRVNADLLRKLDAAERLCCGAPLGDRYFATRPTEGEPGNQNARPAESGVAENATGNPRTVDLASLEEGASPDRLTDQPRVEHAMASFESFASGPPTNGPGPGSSSIPYMTPTCAST